MDPPLIVSQTLLMQGMSRNNSCHPVNSDDVRAAHSASIAILRAGPACRFPWRDLAQGISQSGVKCTQWFVGLTLKWSSVTSFSRLHKSNRFWPQFVARAGHSRTQGLTPSCKLPGFRNTGRVGTPRPSPCTECPWHRTQAACCIQRSASLSEVRFPITMMASSNPPDCACAYSGTFRSSEPRRAHPKKAHTQATKPSRGRGLDPAEPQAGESRSEERSEKFRTPVAQTCHVPDPWPRG
jgi:hypothetical protein